MGISSFAKNEETAGKLDAMDYYYKEDELSTKVRGSPSERRAFSPA
jgi:hypothetical protein